VHVLEAALASVAQRPAAERGEPRAEDHAGVDEVLVGDDAFTQDGDCLR
jgi:hypothetical protein